MAYQVFANTHSGVHVFFEQDGFAKTNPTTDDTDFKFKIALLNFLIRVNQCYQRHQW